MAYEVYHTWTAHVLSSYTTLTCQMRRCPNLTESTSFITMFTTVRHLSLSRVRSIQSTPWHPSSLKSSLILSSLLLLDLPCSFFLRCFTSKVLHAFLFSPQMRHISCQFHAPKFNDPNNIRWDTRTKFFTTKFSSLSCYCLLFRPKYLPTDTYENKSGS